MPNLLVRNVDEKVVAALKKRAGKENLSAEALHRKILEEALLSRRRTFEEVLASMPNVGEDSDFERVNGQDRADVFD